ncbi:hypothetical protein [Brevibacillus brevis]|nr:hypothetical protein [Brevibacillus brevis]
MSRSGLNRVLTIIGNMEQHGTKRHVKNACKEWLLQGIGQLERREMKW